MVPIYPNPNGRGFIPDAKDYTFEAKVGDVTVTSAPLVFGFPVAYQKLANLVNEQHPGTVPLTDCTGTGGSVKAVWVDVGGGKPYVMIDTSNAGYKYAPNGRRYEETFSHSWDTTIEGVGAVTIALDGEINIGFSMGQVVGHIIPADQSHAQTLKLIGYALDQDRAPFPTFPN